MAIKDWFISLFKNGKLDLSAAVGELASEVFFKELAIQSCINLIANTLTKAEFQTFEKGKEVKGDNYYLFNVEPNQNKSASKFWRDVVYKLVYDNECLVIQNNGKLYVADSFDDDKFAFLENTYKNIVIETLKLDRTYSESDVLHFELHNEKISSVITGLYAGHSKLIAAAQMNYKRNNSPRGKVSVPTNYPQTEEAQKELKDLFERKFKTFFNADAGAIIPLTNGITYEELASNIGVKGADNKEIRAFVDDIFDFVAIAFNIPPQLIKGTVADTEKAVDNLLMFCINPLAETISDEINRKYYKKKLYLERTYVRVNTSMIRATSIKDIAGALETLFRIGAHTVDDCLEALGMEPLDTDWSKTRFVTKNYEPIETRIAGGDGQAASP